MPQQDHCIAVVGGGINGLAAAWSAWLASGAGPTRVILLESSDAVGGKARTRRAHGFLFEEGPTGFLSGDACMDRLIELAQLEPLPARAQAARRYVVRGNRARRIHTHPIRFALSGVLSPAALLRMAREPWIPATQLDEESVWEFARRRLGEQAADRLIAPMVLGVFAGDAKRLSLPSAFPRMAEMERQHGSLFRAMGHLMKSRKQHGGPAGPAGSLCSFAGGMQSLPLALAQRAPFEVRCNAPVQAIEREVGTRSWRLQVQGPSPCIEADQVILACDTHANARLLAPLAPDASRELAELHVPGVAVVALAYPTSAKFPTGFGALVPRGEGIRCLGFLFDSQLFGGRSPNGSVLVRCLIGGATDPEAVGLPKDQLGELARAEVGRLFRIREPGRVVGCVRHAGAIPQYELGHASKLQRIQAGLQAAGSSLDGLHLAGCHRAGVAFGKSAAEGWRVGQLAGKQSNGQSD